MKPIRLSNYFDRSYKKRVAPIENMRNAYVAHVSAFQAGERGQPLNDHVLKGKLKGKRVFSIAGDVRVVYEETEEATIFLDVGSHNQVYN